jgi:UDP-N-acetylmuramoylalanine--D-glutamate ligase
VNFPTHQHQHQPQIVAVLGAGESGEAAAILAAAHGAKVTVIDSAEESRLAKKQQALEAHGVRMLAGAAWERDETPYDLVVLSPGIDPAAPLVRRYVERGLELTGELELAFEYCRCPVIAITGTNGKTTTTQLVETMLKACGVRTVAAGNIGPAFSARVGESAQLDVMTLEVSSFQLETIRKFRPQISVWLNFAPDHLDRYHSMEEYYAAKIRVFENQTADDWAIVKLGEKLPPLAARTLTFSAYASGGDFDLRAGVIHFRGAPVLRLAEAQLRGTHNAENLMAALGVGFVRGLSFEQMGVPLCAYKALPHRCEVVRTLDGVEYVNDTKATNLDAMEKALASESRPVVLIAGGKDKGFEFDSVTGLIAGKCRAAILIGEMAGRIESCWKDRVLCVQAGWSLKKAVELARQQAQPGDVVLLSPGTSSFDMFKNYADRGNQFRAFVQALPEATNP